MAKNIKVEEKKLDFFCIILHHTSVQHCKLATPACYLQYFFIKLKTDVVFLNFPVSPVMWERGKGDRQGELKKLEELTLITPAIHAHHEKQKKIEILPTMLYNLYMEEIKYLLVDFIDRFKAAEPPTKKQMIKEEK